MVPNKNTKNLLKVYHNIEVIDSCREVPVNFYYIFERNKYSIDMNSLIEKIGMDKVAHFGVGGLITAIFTIVCLLQDMAFLIDTPWRMMLYPFIGVIVTTFVSVIKELFFDAQRDWKDLYAALIGSVTVFIAVFFGIVFHIATMAIN